MFYFSLFCLQFTNVHSILTSVSFHVLLYEKESCTLKLLISVGTAQVRTPECRKTTWNLGRQCELVTGKFEVVYLWFRLLFTKDIIGNEISWVIECRFDREKFIPRTLVEVFEKEESVLCGFDIDGRKSTTKTSTSRGH